jgi:hypothetical protein
VLEGLLVAWRTPGPASHLVETAAGGELSGLHKSIAEPNESQTKSPLSLGQVICFNPRRSLRILVACLWITLITKPDVLGSDSALSETTHIKPTLNRLSMGAGHFY